MGFPRLDILPSPQKEKNTASSLPKHGFHLGVANAGIFDSILCEEAMVRWALVSAEAQRHWLVVEPTPPKDMKVNWDDEIPN